MTGRFGRALCLAALLLPAAADAQPVGTAPPAGAAASVGTVAPGAPAAPAGAAASGTSAQSTEAAPPAGTAASVGAVAPGAAAQPAEALRSSGLPEPAMITRAPAARNSVNPRDFGAVCDGRHRTIGEPRAAGGLGLRTTADIVAYAEPSGTRPFAWLADKIWQPHVALPLRVPAPAGSRKLYFENADQVPVGAVVTGSAIPGNPATVVVDATNPGPITATVRTAVAAAGTTTLLVSAAAGIVAGSRPLPQPGLGFDDEVVGVDGNAVTLKFGTTAPIAAGTAVVFQPPASIELSAPLSAPKPAISTGAATPAANYWVYFSWPLTDAMAAAGEMDFYGQQAAIEAAYAAPTGGLVEGPAGKCVNNNAAVPGSGVGWLYFHDGLLTHEASVDFVGAGVGATQEIWPADFGAGRAMIAFGDPAATWDNGLGRYGPNFYYGRLAEMSIVGPGGTEGRPGTVTARTSGILSGARRRLVDVSVRGAYVGITYEGVDHTDWQNVETAFNTYGIRMGAASSKLYGNNAIDHLETYLNTIANIALDKDAYWYSDVKAPFYCADAPYCFRLEEGSPDRYGQPTGAQLQNSTFSAVLAENLGNGFIADAGAGPNGTGQGKLNIVNTTWTEVSLLSGETTRIAGEPFNYWIDSNSMFGTRFRFQTNGILPVPGMKAAFRLDNANYHQGGDYIAGDLTATFAAFGAVPFITLGSAPYVQQQAAIRLCQEGAWCGHVEVYGSGPSVGQGTPLEYVAGTGGADLTVAPSTGTRPFGGINMTAATTPGKATIVATRLCSEYGGNPVTLPISGTVNPGGLI
ncbi:MAG TPA: hypothetical protein VGC09_17695, partial [Rhodopila sp.]